MIGSVFTHQIGQRGSDFNILLDKAQLVRGTFLHRPSWWVPETVSLNQPWNAQAARAPPLPHDQGMSIVTSVVDTFSASLSNMLPSASAALVYGVTGAPANLAENDQIVKVGSCIPTSRLSIILWKVEGEASFGTGIVQRES